MPTGRAVLLLRRLSTGDNRLKNINLNQNTKEPLIANPICNNRDLGFSKRLSTFGHNNLIIPQVTRNFSDNKIKMTSPSPDSTTPRRTNRLFREKSPYLLQHAHNPVQWYPWCQEAIDKARSENKLIFLSVGYSTCHWCHVMEKDSFENEDVAKIMNEHYVNIKVDREERPEIDKMYMMFVTSVVGRGGWPMSVFLTPELRPISGGTFFPREDQGGRPGFKTVLLSLAKKWNENRDQIMQISINFMEALQSMSTITSEDLSLVLNAATWDKCVRKYIYLYEPEFGGFGLGPKFPQASLLSFLFHYYARDKKHPLGKECLDMCLYTLTNMAKGGIHDHVNGGFARYSVDGHWHVPHFEKMLYDQAQLIVAYTDGFLASKDKFYADIVRHIIQYVNRDLRHESGGYYSAEDADSYPEFGAPEKKEGAFYVWEYNEIKQLLEDKKLNNTLPYFDLFCDHFNVDEDGNVSPTENTEGNFTNKNVLIIYGCEEDTARSYGITLKQFNRVICECLAILYEAQQKRPRPHLDSKMLCSWNGLMISGLAQAGQGLGEKDYVDDAIKTANFIKEHLYNASGKTLLHSCYRDDDGSVAQTDQPIKGFLDDYAFLIKGLLDLYEASFDSNWLTWARELQQTQNELFWDPVNGGYYNCTAEDNSVLLRLKTDQDGAEPSGNSVSCHNLQRLAAYADKGACPDGAEPYRQLAKKLLKAFVKQLKDVPESLPAMLSALMFYHDSPTQVLISGGRTDPRTLELVRVVRSRLLPGRVLSVADPAAEPPVVLSRNRSAGDVPTAYVCRRYACSLPVTDVRQLENILDEAPAPVTSQPFRH